MAKKEKKEKGKKIIDDELLEILACPKCKGDLELDEKNSGLICKKCELFYRVEDGIPVMLIDEAVPLSELKKVQR